MKNFKNTVAAMTMMVVMGLSATFANAGILLGDRGIPTNTPEPCTKDEKGPDSGILLGDLVGGILVIGFAGGGILVIGRDADTTCKN